MVAITIAVDDATLAVLLAIQLKGIRKGAAVKVGLVDLFAAHVNFVVLAAGVDRAVGRDGSRATGQVDLEIPRVGGSSEEENSGSGWDLHFGSLK